MKKLFISADIEGTCGILHWDETLKDKKDHAYFARQMTLEVAAACEGAHASGVQEILVRDAHDSARNLMPDLLPPYTRVLRGWAPDPYCMMTGLDASYDGVVFTGYHSAALWDGNPLAHTMDTAWSGILINGEIASELMLNSYTAAYESVPVLAVTGDEMLCQWMKDFSPGTAVVPVSRGVGAASLSLHPQEAIRRIRETVQEAVTYKREDCLVQLPEYFEVSITFKKHGDAYRNSFYPGARLTAPHTIAFETDDYYEVLRLIHFM